MPDENNSKPDADNSNRDIFNIMKDLQPVAFLLSFCLVIAAFYSNPGNGVSDINLSYILAASFIFFIAYVSFFVYKKTNFPLFLYFGEGCLIGAALFVYRSFFGIAEMIDKVADHPNSIYVFVLLFSFDFIPIMYLSGKIKNGKIYDFSKIFFHLSLIFFCLHIILFLFGLQTWFQVSFLSWLEIAAFYLFIITEQISFTPLCVLYILKFIFPRILDSFTKLKNEGVFSINPIESLEVIANLLGIFCLPLIGFCLLLIGFWSLVRGLGFPIDNMLILSGVIAIFIITFCLTWYREMIESIDIFETLFKR